MNIDAQVHAAEALANLARGNSNTQGIIAKAGGIGPLLAMLTVKSTAAQAQAASALAQLTRRNKENQVQVARQGGIPLLVPLLQANELSVQAMAALALTEVCRENVDNQTDAADGGCIISLVEQLKAADSSQMDAVKAEAVGALWVLSQNHPQNKAEINRKGGIAPIVGLLAAGSKRSQFHAASALASLGFDNVPNQVEITTLLVSLLSTGSSEAKKNASMLLKTLVEENPSSNDEIATAGPISDLIGLLKDGTDEAKRYALWSLSLSINEQNHKTILEEEAVKPLVAFLVAPAPIVRQQAAAAVAKIAAAAVSMKNNKAVLEIAKKGAIRPLIHIVSGGGESSVDLLEVIDEPAGSTSTTPGQIRRDSRESNIEPGSEAGDASTTVELSSEAAAAASPALAPAPEIVEIAAATTGSRSSEPSDLDDGTEARKCAANALAELASLSKNSTAIVAAGGIRPLVQLLIEGDDEGKQCASAALARLATGNRQTAADIATAGAIVPLVDLLRGSCGDAAQQEAAGALFALADDNNNRVAITDAGGIGPLVTLLGSSNERSRQHAKGVLVRLSIESANRAIIIKELVGMLVDSEASAQEQAAAALANLASETAENRVSIVDAGGISPLLKLLENGSPLAKENSMAAIAKLAYNSETIQRNIAAAGGIPLLAGALAASSNAKELIANWKLFSLAAEAMSQLALGNRENQIEILKEGAVGPLVAMLGAPIAELQANAAECLGNLSYGNFDNQAAIARTGAIAPLCTLVREGADEDDNNPGQGRVKEQAACAIWSMATDNKPNKDTVAKLGGIEPLVTLLLMGTTDGSLEQATGALSALSAKHNDNRESIAKLIVARLSSRNAMLQTPTAAVRLLSAVSKMCHGSQANQAAIAKAGGVPPLILWLSGGFDSGKGGVNSEAQAAAATALLSMVVGNEPLQALIARSNGIPPLIELISKGSQATQEAAARLLWHLAGNAESGAAIANAQGMKPLCGMLLLENVHAQELAATVVARLLKSSSSIAQEFCGEDGGSVVPLVKLLSTGSAAGQQQAACALAEVALVVDNREPIAAAGGIEALVALLSSNVVGTSEMAAKVLSNLAKDGGVKAAALPTSAPSPTVVSTDAAEPKGSSDDGLEPGVASSVGGEGAGASGRSGGAGSSIHGERVALRSFEAEAARARRQSILSAGGIKQLISMLVSVSLPSVVIARKMSELVAKVVGQGADLPSAESGDGKSTKGIKLISEDEVIGAQEQAAATISDLAFSDPMMQREIISEDGVPPLLSLLRSGSTVSQEHAARAIWTLCMAVENQCVIVEGGAIPELVGLFKTGSQAAQGYAAAVISELSKGALAARNAEPAGTGNDAVSDPEIPDTASSQDGELLTQCAVAIPSLVALLNTGSEMAKEQAVGALWQLSTISAHRDAIAKAGGVPPIIQLLDDGTPAAYAHVVAVLARLAEGAPDNQTQIAKKLVTLLTSPNEGAQRRAAHSLWDLANDHPGAPVRIVNAGAISPLVTLLGSGPVEAKEEAVGVLSCLAANDTSNQLAIATGLVALQGLAPEEAKEQLAVMVADFQNAPDIKAAIARAGSTVRGSDSDAAEGSSKVAKVAAAKKKISRMKAATARESKQGVARQDGGGASSSIGGDPPASERARESQSSAGSMKPSSSVKSPPKLQRHKTSMGLTTKRKGNGGASSRGQSSHRGQSSNRAQSSNWSPPPKSKSMGKLPTISDDLRVALE